MMVINRIEDEQLLRNNQNIIIATKNEGSSFKEMDIFEYEEGLLSELRDKGYRIFFGYRGAFAVDDFITAPHPSIRIDLDEFIEIEKVFNRKINKPSRR
jgi:hypothetical protein